MCGCASREITRVSFNILVLVILDRIVAISLSVIGKLNGYVLKAQLSKLLTHIFGVVVRCGDKMMVLQWNYKKLLPKVLTLLAVFSLLLVYRSDFYEIKVNNRFLLSLKISFVQ